MELLHVIVVRKGRGPRRLTIGRLHLGGLAAVGLVLALGASLGGYLLGRHRAGGFPKTAVAGLQARLAEKTTALKQMKIQSQEAINAIAARMAQLDAEVNRLDAMGAEIVKLAGLKTSGFDFKTAAGEGGPAPASETPWSAPGLDAAASALSDRLWGEDRQLSALETLLMHEKLSDQIVPRGIPIRGGWISSGWGWRTDPITGEKEFHEGIDFAGREGDPVHAIAAGIVTWAGPRYGYGRLVIINDGDGYTTYYAHNEKILVSVGQVVERGDSISLLGDTGRSTGPHLHLEIHHNGRPVDPAKYVAARPHG